ncbi:GAF and ANTAR domain-containing protein [Curtobacterium flaccumfaciens]|uniref:GAF and ANTAR domain-containing protein n=1 Tax=Curtobacterium flaccumfaciens TaxID=2035 RepID=UPI001BDE1A2D|nr:GAF and ANTAR domain-containing protein [Curtobacterium flaccumfaciens]MBT1633109.1 ANTAR domain-containing protein [Curtobacterium flaccumfaciens pv. oortii]MCX2843544.1 GAF and ANTAR domain-containing protein [Curtobacterium flaccumfaciens pv. oortii]
MKYLVYGISRVMTGDAIADAVLAYSVALAQHSTTDVINVPTADAHGVATTVGLILGPATTVLTEPAPDDELEPEDDGFVAELARRTARFTRHVSAVEHADGFDGIGAALEEVLDPTLDVLDAMDRVIEICIRCTSATEAGIVLADRDGMLHVIASTSERSSDAEEAQLGTNEGSCLDCYRTGDTIDVPDVTTRASDWPVFVETMRDRGLVGTFAEPIRLRRTTIGSLCVFAAHDQGHDDRDVVFIQMLADAASAALVRQRDHGRLQTLDEQIRDAIDGRVTVEQAKGALAHRRDIAIDAAFQVLRTGARSTGRGLRELANDVIRRGERLDDVI